MEPLTTTTITQSISTLPTVTSTRCLHSPPLPRSTVLHLCSRGLRLSSSLPKVTKPEETSSTSPNRFLNEDHDSVTRLGPKVESAAVEESQMFEVLDKLHIKLESEDGYSIILYGSGALVALWLASVLVRAIDSIPLFPKLMEVVGLGYTFWFSSRYLLFKKNREELATKIEKLKEQILGSDGD